MIRVDKQIENKLKGLNNQYSELSTSIFNHRFIELIVCILTLITSIVVLKYFSNDNNLTIGILLFLFMWILNMYYIILLNTTIETKKENQTKIQIEIENLKDFSTYLLAYRHLESIKNGENIYPELRENDSKYVVNQYKDFFEKARIKYEKDKIIEL